MLLLSLLTLDARVNKQTAEYKAYSAKSHQHNIGWKKAIEANVKREMHGKSEHNIQDEIDRRTYAAQQDVSLRDKEIDNYNPKKSHASSGLQTASASGHFDQAQSKKNAELARLTAQKAKLESELKDLKVETKKIGVELSTKGGKNLSSPEKHKHEQTIQKMHKVEGKLHDLQRRIDKLK